MILKNTFGCSFFVDYSNSEVKMNEKIQEETHKEEAYKEKTHKEKVCKEEIYRKRENVLYCGDNLEIMRKYIPSESVDLCYIDPPFCSGRDYKMNGETMFTDKWTWDSKAQEAYKEIIENKDLVYTEQSVLFCSVLFCSVLFSYHHLTFI
jgi:16S rRNA G966 N2-methylase RsmD